MELVLIDVVYPEKGILMPEHEGETKVWKRYGGEKGKDWTGPFWNEVPFEQKALLVDSIYMRDEAELGVEYPTVVIFPHYNYPYGSPYSKNDIKNKKIPMFILLPKEYIEEYPNWHIEDFVNLPDVLTIYSGWDLGSDTPSAE